MVGNDRGVDDDVDDVRGCQTGIDRGKLDYDEGDDGVAQLWRLDQVCPCCLQSPLNVLGAVDVDVRVSIRLKYSVDAGIVASHTDRLDVLQLMAWKMISMAALDGKNLNTLVSIQTSLSR